jgi:hypothetical protein
MVEIDKVKLVDFFVRLADFYMRCYSILIFLIRRRFVTETFCSRDVVLQETLCYGDVLLRRCFVWRRFVEETFCKETFCMCATHYITNRIFLPTLKTKEVHYTRTTVYSVFLSYLLYSTILKEQCNFSTQSIKIHISYSI